MLSIQLFYYQGKCWTKRDIELSLSRSVFSQLWKYMQIQIIFVNVSLYYFNCLCHNLGSCRVIMISCQPSVGLWVMPRRLGYCSNRNIRDTVHHSLGLERLMHKTFEQHMKCPSCMIGKSTLEDLPKLKDCSTAEAEGSRNRTTLPWTWTHFLHQWLRLKGTLAVVFCWL